MPHAYYCLHTLCALGLANFVLTVNLSNDSIFSLFTMEVISSMQVVFFLFFCFSNSNEVTLCGWDVEKSKKKTIAYTPILDQFQEDILPRTCAKMYMLNNPPCAQSPTIYKKKKRTIRIPKINQRRVSPACHTDRERIYDTNRSLYL